MPPITTSSLHTAIRSSVVDSANLMVSQTSYPTLSSRSSAQLNNGQIAEIVVSTMIVVFILVVIII